MPSFDIVSKVDPQLLDNALNTVNKEIQNRYDFRDTKGSIDHDKKTNIILVTTENTMRLGQIEDIIINKFLKQNIDGTALDFSKEEYASGAMIKKEIKVRAGLDKEDSKKIVKIIKDQKLKVQPAIMDDQIRVTGKKIDDLQEAIAALRKAQVGIPLQFVNMKS